MKKKNHPGMNRGIMLIILAVILIGVAVWNIARPYLDRYQSARDYKKLSHKIVKVEEQDDREKKKDWWLTDVKIQFDELKAQNPDIIAWIRFDNLNQVGIDYPVLYSGDDKKYLRRDVYGNDHIAGSIFLEGKNRSDFSDNYNIIYGHNMNNGSMFGHLKKYRESNFWEKNQYFTIYTEDQVYRYKIFACQHAKDGGSVFRVGYQNNDEYQNFIEGLLSDSEIQTEVHPTKADKIITLSTCTGNGYSRRMTVHALCVDEQKINTDEPLSDNLESR